MPKGGWYLGGRHPQWHAACLGRARHPLCPEYEGGPRGRPGAARPPAALSASDRPSASRSCVAESNCTSADLFMGFGEDNAMANATANATDTAMGTAEDDDPRRTFCLYVNASRPEGVCGAPGSRA